MERIKLADRIRAYEPPSASNPAVLPYGMTMDTFLSAIDRLTHEGNDSGFAIHCGLPDFDITPDMTLSETLYRLAEANPKTSDDLVYGIMVGSFAEILEGKKDV